MRFAHPITIWLACLTLLVGLLTPHVLHAAPRQQPSSNLPVYGIQGHFEALSGSAFGEVFVAADGTRLTVVGVNATVAQQIDVLARQLPPPTVKIWGTRNFDPKPDYVSDLVVSEILPEGDVAQPAPQPTRGPQQRHPSRAGSHGRGQLQPRQSLQYTQPVHVDRSPGACRRALQPSRP